MDIINTDRALQLSDQSVRVKANFAKASKWEGDTHEDPKVQSAWLIVNKVAQIILHLAHEFVQLLKILTVRRAICKEPGPDTCSSIAVIHGLCGLKSNWNYMLNRLEERGAGRLGNFHPIALNLRNHSIDADAEIAMKELLILSKAAGDKGLHLIGHSRGGLVALVCARKLWHDHGIKVRGVVTIASPLRGSPWASFGAKYLHFLRLVPLRDLALESRVLEEVAAFSSNGPLSILHLVAERDLLVPPECAQLQGNAVTSIATGHLGILTEPVAVDTLYKWLTERV